MLLVAVLAPLWLIFSSLTWKCARPIRRPPARAKPATGVSVALERLDSARYIGLYRAVGEPGRNDADPRFCDACFTGDYPISLDDRDGPEERQLSLLTESA